MLTVTLHINGKAHTLAIEGNWTLLYVLRECLQLFGSKFGCGTGDCGACKVLVDGKAVNSCTTLARNMEGHEIITIEGLSRGEQLHPVQQAFIDAGAIQCGYCTPGMVISTVALLSQNPNPGFDEVAAALDNNLCRCTGYKSIYEAVLLAAKRMRGEDA